MKSLALNVAAPIIVVLAAVLPNGAGSAPPSSSVSCGCSQPTISNVPCLVSTAEDTFAQKVLDKPQPTLPTGAKTASVSGNVTVGVIVDQTGGVIFAWVEKSDNAALSSAAVDAAYKLRVKPTLLSGRAVNVKSVVTYTIRLA